MKKLVSLVLAALMLLSVVAFAASNDTTFVVTAPTITYTFSADNVDTGSVQTDIYLKVIAKGQIDVTVPLFLVFSTDVDGGKATEPSNYIIYNNNTESAVGVTKIAVTSKSDKMTLTSENGLATALGAHAYDTYMVKLTASADTYDLGLKTYEETTDGKALPGLSIPKDQEVNLKPEMQTTAISFITGEKYVKILNIEYTLGLIYDTVDTVDLPTESIVAPSSETTEP